jgi:hypothetical protein
MRVAPVPPGRAYNLLRKRDPKMYCYNPKTRHEEDVPTPPNDARAIEMLTGHPDSEEFIEEYGRRRKTHGIEKAMIITREAFFRNHHPAIMP